MSYIFTPEETAARLRQIAVNEIKRAKENRDLYEFKDHAAMIERVMEGNAN